jgi:light-regulated signal transduction histidine kinase (bacteriophytochrome)
VASHDLQEPLRMVSGFMQIIADRYRGRLDEKADEYIRYAVDGAQRMRQLIEDLLAFSRVDRAGRKPKPTALQSAVDRARANLRAAVEESGARMTAEELPTVLGDEMQLSRLYQNLIGNALKFRREDAPLEIHLGARREGDHWVLSVRDNGIGIAPEHFERVFMIFQRLHTREKYSGTGIGLAICKRIVERHGGKIWVESTPGEGSTFYFTIPGGGDPIA